MFMIIQIKARLLNNATNIPEDLSKKSIGTS